MSLMRGLSSKLGTAGELVELSWRQKHWWLLPMILVLVGIRLLFVFAQGSALAPFLYTLF